MRPRLLLLFALFFFSGVCGLTYQVLWLRLLALVFGVTAYAASTVLAAFMAGLALGSVFAGSVLQRVERPLLIFGAAEILIGVFALLTPFGLDAASFVYRTLYQANPESLGLVTVARLVCSLIVLLPPTVLMGLTLPVLSASPLVREAHLGSRISALYAINTAGAVTGALVTGFVLIGAIGMQRSFLLAAAVNIAVGVAALVLARSETVHSPQSSVPSGPPSTVHSPQSAPRPVGARSGQAAGSTIAIVIAVSGFASLALEIVWFRMLVQYLDANIYAFTIMLATVLAGIALGGAIAARLLRRPRDLTLWLANLQLATGLAVLVSAIFLGWSYAAGWRTGAAIQACVSAILPAAILMGISFPVALRMGIGETAAAGSTTGRRVGRLYALNVAGAIGGALAGGFVLLPLVGIRRGLIAAAALYLATGVFVALRHVPRRAILAGTAAAVALFAVLAVRTPDPFAAAFARRYGQDMREFWRDEGVQTAVSVHASQFRRSLYLDGLHQANDTPDMVHYHRLIGHLPMLLHSAPADALVIGLGGGATAGAVSQYPGVRVQIVELSDSVRRAAPFFSHISYDVLQQPHVRLRVDDGRNFLLLSGEQFDVITADIIQPSHAGAGNLYSREYFTLMRRALKENGLALQWVGNRAATEYQLIMRTFLDVFPHATVWVNGGLMVGSLTPLKISPENLTSKLANPQTRAALADIGLRDFETLKSWYTAGPDAMRRLVGEGPVLTDDQPRVEYHRSLPRSGAIDLTGLTGDVSEVLAGTQSRSQ